MRIERKITSRRLAITPHPNPHTRRHPNRKCYVVLIYLSKPGSYIPTWLNTIRSDCRGSLGYHMRKLRHDYKQIKTDFTCIKTGSSNAFRLSGLRRSQWIPQEELLTASLASNKVHEACKLLNFSSLDTRYLCETNSKYHFTCRLVDQVKMLTVKHFKHSLYVLLCITISAGSSIEELEAVPHQRLGKKAFIGLLPLFH